MKLGLWLGPNEVLGLMSSQSFRFQIGVEACAVSANSGITEVVAAAGANTWSVTGSETRAVTDIEVEGRAGAVQANSGKTEVEAEVEANTGFVASSESSTESGAL